MVYKFLVLSDEVDNFAREIKIDADATFLDLQNAILDSVNYTKDQMTSFFICDDDWEKKTEITLVDMDSSTEEDSWIMADTKLSDLLEDEKQKLLFVFDYMTERSFFMELRSIETGKDLDAPIVTRSEGEAPVQLESFDDFSQNASQNTDFNADLYGDEEYDPDELDEEGFSDFDASQGDPYSDDL
ncbi:MAG: hypothetical protein Q4F97_12290 [Bacteroidales bacterium]|nr:hypothetical protein [Bacteroidales bacterium]